MDKIALKRISSQLEVLSDLDISDIRHLLRNAIDAILIGEEKTKTMKIKCNSCGEPVSNELPTGTIVRAWVECEKCITKILCPFCYGGSTPDSIVSQIVTIGEHGEMETRDCEFCSGTGGLDPLDIWHLAYVMIKKISNNILSSQLSDQDRKYRRAIIKICKDIGQYSKDGEKARK
jgi:hypothetical protein